MRRAAPISRRIIPAACSTGTPPASRSRNSVAAGSTWAREERRREATELAQAEADDLLALAAFVNRAYRGDTARRGWTHEADLLDGQRTDVALLAETIAKPGAILLLRAPDGAIRACVHVRPIDAGPVDSGPLRAGLWQLGMLTVDPDAQGRGIGRRVVAAVEARARSAGVAAIEMTVIHGRDTLLAWYARLGYRPTPRTAPFPYGQPRFGLPRRDDLYFVVLEKRL